MLITKLENGQPEVFLTVQGEGTTIGKPCIFIRFSVCNLACKWCDSYFTWNFDERPGENKHSKPKVKKEIFQMLITQDELIKEIQKFECKNLVFTGGEPTIYQKELIEVMNKLREINKDYYFEVETNGTLVLQDPFIELINQINCSPKLASSGNASLVANRSAAINKIKDFNETIFKFVICKKTIAEDIVEIQQWQEQYCIQNNRIWLMPEGITRKDIIIGSKIIVENFCKLGYNLSPRLHVLLWQNKRAT